MHTADVYQHFRTQQEIADFLQISRAAVAKWPEVVPEGTAYKLQVLTAGKLRVNPALYPTRAQRWAAAK